MTIDASKGNDKQASDAYDCKRSRKRPAFLKQETLDRIANDHAKELRELVDLPLPNRTPTPR